MFSKNPRKRIGLNFSLRLTFWYFVIFTANFACLYLIADYLLERSLEEKRGELLLTRAQEYRAHFEREGLRGLQSRFEERAKYTQEAFFIRVVGPVGNVLFFKFPTPEQQFDLNLLDQTRDRSTRQWIKIPSQDQNSDWLVLSLPLGQGQALQLGHNSQLDDEDRHLLKSIFFNLFIPFLVIALLGGWLLTAQAIQPIRRLVQTIRDILRTGKMDTRMPDAGVNDDLRELVEIFNRLLDQNQKLITAMNQSLDNVAHDLRTPMARLRASAEMALQKEADFAADREALQDCLEESDRVVQMLNALMDVSEAQTGTMRLHREELWLSELARNALELFELSAEEKQIHLELLIESEAPLTVDRLRMQQVLVNLIDNAIKYSSEGSHVKIRIFKTNQKMSLEVYDQGTGISEQDLPRIWERLYRGDRSRSQRGLGLGLSLVKAIVEAHGAQIEVESQLGQGSCFRVIFP